MLDYLDASNDRLRLAVARGLRGYNEAELLECLRDPDPILRTTAARELHIRGTPSTFRRALELVGEIRYDDREIGSFVLGQLGTPDCPFAGQSFEPLRGLLSDPYHEVRSAAVRALGSLASLGFQPSPDILEQIIQLSSDQEPAVRSSTASALGVIHDKSAEACLRKMLTDTDPVVLDTVEFAIDMHENRTAAI